MGDGDSAVVARAHAILEALAAFEVARAEHEQHQARPNWTSAAWVDREMDLAGRLRAATARLAATVREEAS